VNGKRKTRPLKIVLASGSPRRKELLNQIGIDPVIKASGAPEICTAKTPAGMVRQLSRKKAEEAAAGLSRGTIVIGADTIVVQDGRVFGKPKDEADAERMLRSLSGKRHSVYTGVTIIRTGMKTVSFSEKTEVDVYPISPAEIRDYIKSGEPMDKAGSYGIQGKFGAWIRGIRGDYTNVVGLPLGRTWRELKKLM